MTESAKTGKSVKLSGIPDELKGYPQWVVWRFEQYKGDKKPRKVPYSPLTGGKTGTRAIDAEKWGTIEQAVQAAKTFKGRFDGIGFVFSQEDPFIGIDLDHCVDDGVPNELAGGIVAKLNSFTEVSPSGTGLHIIVKGKKPGTRCKRNLEGDQAIEVYDKERFFTVTGKRLGVIALINQDQGAFEDVYHEYVEQVTDNDKPVKSATSVYTPVNLSDKDLLDIISRSKTGAEFDLLFQGDMSAYENDHSRADMALCQKLAFWTGKNSEQIDRIFRQSALMRPKWNEKRGQKLYSQMTIEKAIDGTTNVCQLKGRKQGASNIVPIEEAKEKKEKKSRKMRSCHMMESPFQPDKPLYDPANPPWPATGSYYWISPKTGDLHVGGTETEPGEIIAQNPIWVYSRAKDIYGEFSLVIKFINYDHKEITVSFPTAILSDTGSAVGKILRAQGMPLIAGKEKMVNRYLDQMAKWCGKSGWAAEKIGWFDGTNPPCFVLPDVVLTATETKEEVFYQPVLQQDAKSLASRGELKEWKEHVSMPAKNNPLLLFGILAGLSGPVNKLARGESGGFHFCGDTSCGKTAVIQGAASVWGNGADPQFHAEHTSIRKWAATISGREAYAQLHNDIVLCLDEIGGAKAEEIGDAIYLLTGGVPKGRSQGEGGIRKQPSWNNILMSTGELTIEQIMREAGQEQKGGQRHRMPDIRCDSTDRGVVTDPTYETRSDRRQFVRSYKDSCAKYYGLAGPAFVSWLLSQIHQKGLQCFLDEVRENVAKFEASITPEIELPSESQRMLDRLAIIGVAGLYAAEIGVIDICPVRIHESITCVRDLWLEELGDEMSEADRTLSYFKHQVLTNISCFKNCNDYEPVMPRKLLGYQNADYIMILVKSIDELCGMHSKKTVLRELEKKNKVELGEINKKTNKRRLDKKANLIHFKERPRCYHIHRDFFE